MTDTVEVTTHSAGRLSGKPWKSATKRPCLTSGVRAKSWSHRMERIKKDSAVKKLQKDLREENQELKKKRMQITIERRKASEEKQRLVESKEKMHLKKSKRLKRKASKQTVKSK